MPTVNIIAPQSITFAWDPETFSGYPAGKGRIVSLEIPATATTSVDPALTYVFPYLPVEADFSGLPLEYVEIDRPGNQKILASRGMQLQKISFKFVVADRESGGVLPVDDELAFLTRMATRDAPVALAGLGSLIGKRPSDEAYRLWRIVDMSFSVRRRDMNGNVTQAEVTMTLSEDHNPDIVTALLPKIEYKPYVVRKSKGKGKGKKATSPDPDDDSAPKKPYDEL